jgi:hypothetical protein
MVARVEVVEAKFVAQLVFDDGKQIHASMRRAPRQGLKFTSGARLTELDVVTWRRVYEPA